MFWKEFACFSYDENHQFRLDDSSLKWYYTPQMGADLSKGFNTFQKQDDSKDEHLESLLKAIMAHEQETGQRIDANVVTWRGMMTKVNFPDNHGRPTVLTILRSWGRYSNNSMGTLPLGAFIQLPSDCF